MKKRKQKIGKELLIFVALLIIIMLSLAVALYDYIPSTVNVPAAISYSADAETTKVKQEIASQNEGDMTADESMNSAEKSAEAVTSLKSYSINASDLSVYGAKNLYNSGNSDPFDYAADDASSDPTAATTTDGSAGATAGTTDPSNPSANAGTTAGAQGSTTAGTTGGTGSTAGNGSSGAGSSSVTTTQTPTSGSGNGSFFDRANSK